LHRGEPISLVTVVPGAPHRHLADQVSLAVASDLIMPMKHMDLQRLRLNCPCSRGAEQVGP
jgi:hypothetical protein